MSSRNRVKGCEKNVACRFVKDTDAQVQRVFQQRIFNLLQFLRATTQRNHFTIFPSFNQTSKNERPSTSGLIFPKAWLLPLLRLHRTISAGLKSMGSIL